LNAILQYDTKPELLNNSKSRKRMKSYNMKTFDELKLELDKFFSECSSLVETKPWAVVIAMHEYFR
jgi:hypothetical protein